MIKTEQQLEEEIKQLKETLEKQVYEMHCYYYCNSFCRISKSCTCESAHFFMNEYEQKQLFKKAKEAKNEINSCNKEKTS